MTTTKPTTVAVLLLRFWIEKSDSGEAIKRVVERIRSTKPSRFLISNITIRSSNFCYHKIFLKDVYTLDRFTLVFLSVYIFQPSIVRMQKVRLLTNWDSMLAHTREADEVFKQVKWMNCSWFTNTPKTGIDRLKQFRIFRLIFLKANCQGPDYSSKLLFYLIKHQLRITALLHS